MRAIERELLRARLRAADPAAGEDGLPPREVVRMRQAVLAAAAPARPSRWTAAAPRWAVAAALVALLAAGALALRNARQDVPTPLAAAASQPAAAPQTAPPRSAPPPVAPGWSSRGAAGDPARQLAESPPAGGVRADAGAAPVDRPPASKPAAPPADAGAQPVPPPDAIAASAPLQVQVTAPGGTRIVWILTPAAGP
jgi:hypothetical protein